MDEMGPTAEKTAKALEALLKEERTFPPPDSFRREANVRDPVVYEQTARDRLAFWESFARELTWFRKWDRVLEWDAPYAKWFVGGRTNLSYNCLDRHVNGPRRNKAAILWEGEPGDERTLTYAQLHREVCRFANALKELGVGQGDRVTLYLPMIPELAVAMLHFLPRRMLVGSLIFLAIWKALLVALYFMHLKFEPRRLIVMVLLPLPLAVILVLYVFQEF